MQTSPFGHQRKGSFGGKRQGTGGKKGEDSNENDEKVTDNRSSGPSVVNRGSRNFMGPTGRKLLTSSKKGVWRRLPAKKNGGWSFWKCNLGRIYTIIG